MQNEIYTGNFGFQILFDTGQDLSESHSFRLRIRNPKGIDKDVKLGNEILIDPKSLGKAVYLVKRGDFTIPGTYKLQLFEDKADKRQALTPVIKYKVKASLDFVES